MDTETSPTLDDQLERVRGELSALTLIVGMVVIPSLEGNPDQLREAAGKLRAFDLDPSSSSYTYGFAETCASIAASLESHLGDCADHSKS